ncbi:MAG TPA: glyceraldehyde 3-phosphate dehydrogenase NAD-binding domain-containing protein [Actinomycetota bacterium]|nr:glyceraldehyde 3-phosphate dehydrogenase NAD-binding domain-containing protein [Actinomycetota bacterium]
MTLTVGVNGFGRIGRLVTRLLAGRDDLLLSAVNTRRGDAGLLAHLLMYDSVHGRFLGDVEADGHTLLIEGNDVRVTSCERPSVIPWHDVDVVVESTGAFTMADEARGHLEGGAGHVVITAPSTGEDLTIVVGVNEDAFDPRRHRVVSAASCTTACLGPVAHVLDTTFGIESGFATTVHAFTRDQELVDGSHDDPRRARSAALNLVPTKTGAAKLLGRILPGLAGRIDAFAIRVPTPDVSLLTLGVVLGLPATGDEVNDVFRAAAKSDRLASVLGVCEEPLVSSDFLGDPRSAVVDAAGTIALQNNHLQVLAWYDNELSYATRVVDILELIRDRSRRPRAGGTPGTSRALRAVRLPTS